MNEVHQGTFGAYITNERLRRGLSLEDVEYSTKIKMHYLVALEQDEFEKYPEQPYVVGFVRAYAKCLGLDEDVVVTHFKYFYQNYLESKQPSKRRSVKLLGVKIPLVTLFLAMLLGGVAFAIIINFQSIASYCRAFIVQRAPLTVFDPTPQSRPTPTPAAKTSSQSFEVSIMARGATWIQIKVDDYAEFSERIRNGEKKNYTATKNVKIRTGDWSIIELYKNGKRIANPSTAMTVNVEDETPPQ